MKRIITLIFLLIAVNYSSAQVTANAGADQEICLYDTLKVTGSGLPAGDTGSYQWRRISSNTVLSITASLQLKIVLSAPEQFELKVTRIKNGQTYIDLDTFDLKVNALPTIAYKGIPALCYNDCPYPLTNNYIAIGSAGYDPTIKDSSLRYYQRKNPSWITGGVNANDPYYISFCNYLNNAQIPSSGARDTICFEYTDPKGCYVNQCRPVKYNPNPIVEIQDKTVCIKSAPFLLNDMVVKPFIKTGGIESYRCLSVPSTSSLDKNSIISMRPTFPVSYDLNTGTAEDTQDVGEYVIEYCFKDGTTGCQTCDTSKVNVQRYGQAYIRSIPSQCINGNLLVLDSFVSEKYSGAKLTGNKWSCVEYNGSRDRSNPNTKLKLDSSVVNNTFNPKRGIGQYMVKCTVAPGVCAANDSLYIRVNGLPIIQINVPDTVCANDTFVPLNNLTPGGKVGTWTGTGVSGWHLNASKLPATKLYTPYKMKYSYTNPLSLCSASDSQTLLVAARPGFTPKAVVHKIFGKFYVDFSIISGSFVDTTKQKAYWTFGNGQSSRYYTNQLVEFKDTGVYTAHLSVSNGPCTFIDSVTFKLDDKMSSTNDIRDQLSLYPNPATDELNVQVPQDGVLSITDIRGVVLYEAVIGADRSLRISTKDFAAGQYILTVKSDAFEVRKLFIKQ